MWEIKFYEVMLVLNTNIPKEFSEAFYFNLITSHDIAVYTNAICELFIEYYDDTVSIPEFALKHETRKLNKWVNGVPTKEIETVEYDAPVGRLDVYVKYVNDYYDVSTNIMCYSCGMFGMKYASYKRKYMDKDCSILDPAMQNYKDEIENAKKFYNVKETRRTTK
jgi:hypothetical protein